MTWVRDTILILVAVGLLVAVLWPSANAPVLSTEANPIVDRTSISGDGAADDVPSLDSPLTIAPVMNVPHRLFPMVEGGRWRYLVSGTKELIPDASWTMVLKKAPTDSSPGELEMGFGDKLTAHKVWLEDGAVRIGGLPFSAPRRFWGTPVTRREGAWIPQLKYVIDDAVWTYQQTRQLLYRTQGKRNQIIEEPAVGIQSDRAQVKGIEKIIVPAGVFDAYQVQWRSRMNIVTEKKKRKVLQELTTEPYKKETTWFAPGIGMVRRRVTYASGAAEDVIFDLVSFTRPNMDNR